MSAEVSVQSIQISRQGNTPLAPKGSTEAPDLTFDEASARWKHLEKETEDLPWSEVPGDMLRDYLLAAIGMIRETYGDNASSKACESLSVILLEYGAEDVVLGTAWEEEGRGFQLSMSTKPLSEDNPVAAHPGVEFGLETDAGIPEDDVRAALASWVSSTQGLLAINPILDAPDKTLRSLTEQVEQTIGKQDDEDARLDTLLATASALLMWEKMEAHNAQHLNVRLAELNSGDMEIAPGKEVVVNATRTYQKPELAPKPLANPPRNRPG